MAKKRQNMAPLPFRFVTNAEYKKRALEKEETRKKLREIFFKKETIR